MKYFKTLDLPILDLYQSFLDLELKWTNHRQICINTTLENNDDISIGVGSLVYDWDNAVEDKNGNLDVPKKNVVYEESDFKYLCTRFIGTPFETVYNALEDQYVLGRVRLMRSDPKTCLTWHVDTSPRVHFPVKTHEGCFMVIEDEIMHLQENTWYWTDTTVHHTAFNGAKESRIHLVASVLDQK